MKTYLLRLFKEDIHRRQILVEYFSEKWGKKASFADILRELMEERCDEIR